MSNPNGRIGGIRNTFLRRVAIVLYGLPLMIIGMAPAYLQVLPAALSDAWAAFADHFDEGNRLLALSIKSAWAATWEPTA